MASMLRPPRADGQFRSSTAGSYERFGVQSGPITGRAVYAAEHLVCDPPAAGTPLAGGTVAWEATNADRQYLWDGELGVAAAMQAGPLRDLDLAVARMRSAPIIGGVM